MATSIFGIGVSALNSAQTGLATAEHNISNLTTPGFNRQQTVQQARQPQFTGAGFVGQGVEVGNVKRVYSEFLDKQVLQEQSLSSQLDSHYAQIRQIDNMLADPISGMAPSIQEFFSSVNNVSNSPESQSVRQAMIDNAQSLSSRFHSINQRLVDLNDGVNSQIRNAVIDVNSYAKQISTLNQNIVLAQAANGRPPNDLLDQRDHLIGDLNKVMKASVVKQSDGSFSVFVGTGQSLVVGAQAFTLKTVLSPGDPSKEDVVYINHDGSTSTIQQSSLSGGALGGLLAFRDKTLTNTQNGLGRVAMSIAGTFNEQHKLGQDLNGDLGEDFFVKPALLAINNNLNKGGATVMVSVAATKDYSAMTGSDYELKFNGGTSYTLTRLSDNKITQYPDSLPQEPVDGLTMSMSGDAVAGDKFLIRPTVNGASQINVALSDTSKIAAAAPIRTQSSLKNLGTGDISEATVNVGPVAPMEALPSDKEGVVLIKPKEPDGSVDVRKPVIISFNEPPTSYRILGLDGEEVVEVSEDGATKQVAEYPYVPGQDISFNGWTVKITGAPVAGDIFAVGSNTNATADGRNGLILAGLQTKNTMSNGTTSYQGAYSQIVSDIGNKTRELEVTSKAQATMVEQTLQTQQSLSGVNMDEEAANLMRYQRAYQAAGKALQIANTMFDSILQLQR
jgi:flagellar hook-associated protein 1 FlgK